MMRKRKRTPAANLPLALEGRGTAEPAKGRPSPVADDGLPFSANARTVLARRYLVRDAEGRPTETPREMLARVARDVAEADRLYDPDADVEATAARFFDLMASLEFLPNSPTLMNAGRELGQLSACFVLPVQDSMDGIFEAVKETALIHKSGGGTGFSFSRLRPAGDPVQSTRGVASGPISFMNVFDAATETVRQGGTRRGANMAILRVDHPDILDFIAAKSAPGRLTNFNLSVAATEVFMQAVLADEEYDLLHPRTGQAVRRLRAREVYDRIVDAAWRSGEPGIVFLDRINRDNPTPALGSIEATNPCGEQPLLPYESCNLGSVNLAVLVNEDGIDRPRLARIVREAVHFLDNVIDRNRYPLPVIEKQTKGNRKIGLGVMGFADALFRLAIPYDSEEAVRLGGEVMALVRREARAASDELAERRGPFPNLPHSIYAGTGRRPRNATVTTIAPTGTLSILAGTTSGIEPAFALAYVRRVLDGQELTEVNPVFIEVAKREGFLSEALLLRVTQTGRVADLPEVPARWRRVFVTSHDIAPEWHIRMQAAFQEHTDNAVSKTVNFPERATRRDVDRAFRLAYELGCKGVTVFRYGTRNPVLNLAGPEAGAGGGKKTSSSGRKPRRATREYEVGCGKLYVTVQSAEGGPVEVSTSTTLGGGCPSQSEAISRLASLALRSGVAVDLVARELTGIPCRSATRRRRAARDPDALPCPSAIAQALSAVHAGGNGAARRRAEGGEPIASSLARVRALVAQGLCPDCGDRIEHEGGCVICRACGFSRCG